MAKKHKKQGPGRPRKSRSKTAQERSVSEKKKQILNIDPETKRGIVAIILFTLAILITLGFRGLSGRFGSGFQEYASLLLGQGIFLVPVILIIAGFIIIKYIHKNVYLPVTLAAVIFIFGFLSLIHVLFSEEQRGGYIGYLVSWPFLYILGKWASFIVFIALIIISILIAFNIPLKRKKEKEDSDRYPDEIEDVQGERIDFEKNKKGGLFKKILPRPKFNIKSLNNDKASEQSTQQEKSNNEELITSISRPPISDYKFPPLNLLEGDKGSPSSGDIRINANIIQRTLDNFGIEVEMGEIHVGPTVTQYTLRPASGVKLSKITALHRDISLALAAHPIRIEAPIPGRSLIGIEIPNRAVTMVRLKNLLEGIDLRKDLSRLNLVLGRDVAGNPVWSDLAKMPHLLVAGATGSGKSICINSLILTLLYQKTPEELKFIMMDPKRVELPRYNDIPHLLTPVIVDLNKTVNALKWAISEMERRYELLAEVKIRDITSYNSMILKGKRIEGHTEILPYIVIIIDELADIMAAYGREVEGAIIRLAQMSRAVGIHLIVSTQRPSVEVITGLIKANITSRVAFQVASQVDSRTILDMSGAEKLLGNGDMLFLSGETAHPKRIQGVYISDDEVKRTVKFIKGGKMVEYTEEVTTPTSDKKSLFGGSSVGGGSDEPLYEEAKELVIRAGKASASYLQRRLQIGYARAARILDIMEEDGVIGPADGAKPREVFVEKEPNHEYKQENNNEEADDVREIDEF